MDALCEAVVIIPAFKPNELLEKTVNDLQSSGFETIVIVDDGSGENFTAIFDQIRPLVTQIVTHSANQGKGRALKTGIAWAMKFHPGKSVVTVDADFQHRGPDVAAVVGEMYEHKNFSDLAITFGVRDFSGDQIPKKSKFGNTVTRHIIKTLFGGNITDTQTGLRAFPACYLDELTHIDGEYYEYEINVLLWILGNHIRVVQVPIQTVYHDIENSQSHFKAIRDSFKIYRTIFGQAGRFIFSSLAGAGIDIIIYTILINLIFQAKSEAFGIIICTIIARIISSLANYFLNRNAVFEDKSAMYKSLFKYYTLAAVVLLSSAVGTAILSPIIGGRNVVAKVIVDSILFVVSYISQKRWVFNDSSLLRR